jgi:hypothetical protein
VSRAIIKAICIGINYKLHKRKAHKPVTNIMVEMLPGQSSFKDNGFNVINQIDQAMANPPQQEPSLLLEKARPGLPP